MKINKEWIKRIEQIIITALGVGLVAALSYIVELVKPLIGQ